MTLFRISSIATYTIRNIMLLFRNHCLTGNGNSLTQVLAVSIFYPLKSSENQRFSGVFRGYKMGTLVKIGFSQLLQNSTTHTFFNWKDFGTASTEHSFQFSSLSCCWLCFPLMNQNFFYFYKYLLFHAVWKFLCSAGIWDTHAHNYIQFT